MANLTATPTEYRGVAYRSKCEAMFALYLDLSINQLSEFPLLCYAYEPDLGTEFACDFICSRLFRRSSIPVLAHCFIEYKPSQPTSTYVDNYFRKFNASKDAFGINPMACVYFGSVYTKKRGAIHFLNGKINNNLIDWDWLEGFEREIAAYRFDLAVQHA